jgi:transcriptional regulator with XRE-family HTH domain
MWVNIEKERERAGLTKEQMCKQIGITVRTYWNYLAGGPIPSDKLVHMAKLFECSTDYLLGLTDRRTTA